MQIIIIKMTDYKEEQNIEIEALESIYTDELQIIETEPFHNFEVNIKSTEEQYSESDPVSLVLSFTYTATYPDEAPVMAVTSSENLEEDHEVEVMALLQEQAEENLGMVMVFTLVSAVQEKLHEISQRIKDDEEDAKIRRIRQQEEEEQKRFEGTRVSVETFMAWKAEFDAEMEEEKRRKGILRTGSKKLTGRELFLKDNTFDDSDVAFMEQDGGTAVEVNEALFEDMDDLDLDELDDET